MRIRRILKSDDGVVGIIVMILVIGLIIMVTGIIQSVYVPQWLEQKEADHMHIVSYQFSQIKQSFDILSVVEQKNAISVYLNFGTSEIPIFGTGRTYDYLNILSENCVFEISNDTNSNFFPLGTVKYSSKNSYFVDQSYIVEAGALILSQSKANILNGKPYFSISDFTNMSLNIVNISGVEGKTFAGGYGTYSFYMEYLNSNSYTIEDFKYINITTSYQNAWRLFFNTSTLKNSGLTYEIKDTVDGISVEFSGTLGILFLKVVEISAQIAPGLLE